MMEKKRLNWHQASLALMLTAALVWGFPVPARACGGMDHGSGSAGMDHSMMGMMGPMGQMGPGPMGPGGVPPPAPGAFVGQGGGGPAAPGPAGSSPPAPPTPVGHDHGEHSGPSTTR